MAGPQNEPVVLSQLEEGRLVIELAGAMAPQQGVGTGVTQRTSRTWLPGASRPVTQVLGPTEEPVVLEGMVRDELSGDGAAQSFHRRMRQVAAEGYLCSLEWGSTWALEGLVEEYTPEWHDEGYLSYRIEFAVHANTGDDTDLGVRPIPERSAADLEALISKARGGALAGRALSMLPLPL